jgi:hypothetical protein
MYFLIELEDCDKRYNQVFNLFENYTTQLNLNMHFVRYEDLVNNLPAEATKLFNYLDIDANDNYLAFHTHAQQHFIKTPSRDQVKSKLYVSSLNKWKKLCRRIK